MEGELFELGNILGEQGYLRTSGKAFRVEVPGKCNLEVPLDEAQALVVASHGPRGVDGELAKLGVLLPNATSDPSVEELRTQLPLRSLVTMLDTTTVKNAFLATDHSQFVTPTTLLDLSITTYAAVYYDRVILQPKPDLQLPPFPKSEMSLPPFYVLQYPSGYTAGPLHGWWAAVLNDLNSGQQKGGPTLKSDLERAWSKFLSTEPGDDVRLDFRACGRYTNSPDHWDGLLASAYFGDLLPGVFLNPAQRDEFLSIQTVRTLFNDRFAAQLGIPYSVGSLKAPVFARLVATKVQTREIVQGLIARVEPSSMTPPSTLELRAPFLVGLAMEGASSPKEYWKAVAELRHDFAPVRHRILEALLAGQPVEEVLRSVEKDLSSDLVKRIHEGKDVIDCIVATGVAVSAFFNHDLALLKAGLALLPLLIPPEALAGYLRKRFQPEAYFLLSIRSEAKALSTLHDQLLKWGVRWTGIQQQELLRLCNCQAIATFR